MNIARLFSVVALFSWVAFFLVLVFVVLQASRKTPVKKAGVVIIVAGVVALLLSTISAGLVFIEPQDRGVVISAIDSKGYREQALEPGLHWVIPFAESVVQYPISRQTYTMSIMPTEGQLAGDDSIEARTSDGQKVLVDASIIYAVDPTQVVNVHITWQNRYDRDLVRAQARGVIRDAVSQFGIEEVYSSKRFELVDMVSGQLIDKFDENGLIMIDFVLRNISFSDEYAASVEQKQIAEQLAQQGKFVVEQKKQEAEQARQSAEGRADAAVIEAQGRADARLIEADAEAKSLLLVADAISGNTDLLTYEYIKQITPNIDVMLLPNNSPFLFPLPEMGPAAPTVVTGE